MNFFLRILKWIGLSIGSLLILIIIAGLSLRVFGSKGQPEGELVDIGGFSLHINSDGQRNTKPTLVIEGGGGMASEYYHWLNEGLKDSLRVVRYDRAGIGYSDLSNSSREAEVVARELHTLLEKSGETPPYILAGHSLGGPYIRVFTQLYPDEVEAMLFLDATHSQQVERLGAPRESSFKYKSYIWLLNAQMVLVDLGVITLYERLFGSILSVNGLPEEINSHMLDFLKDGKYIRGFIKETSKYHATLARAGQANEFDSLPIRVFTAIEINREADRARGINSDLHLAERIEAQKEFADLSTNGKQFLIEGNHSSIFTKKENADKICEKVIQLIEELGY